MFQWSSNRRRTDSNGGSNNNSTTHTQAASSSSAHAYPFASYPGAVIPAANAVQGSLRPPVHKYSHLQHLDSYLSNPTLKPSTRKVPPGDSTFDTVFQTIHGDTLILRVQLPPNAEFSSCRPTMSLAGVRAQHAWLDARMQVVGYEPIQSETAWQNSLLGSAVHAVVQEFQIRPPRILEFVDLHLRNIQSNYKQQQQQSQQQHDDAPPDYSTVLNGDATTVSNNNMPPLPGIDMPTLPTQFPWTDALDRDKLDELLRDELEFHATCHQNIPMCQELQAIASSVVDANANTAKLHLQDDQPQLEQLAATCQTLQQKLQEKVAAFEKLQVQQDQLCRPPDRRQLIRALQSAKKEAFERSEQLAEEWLDSTNGSDVDTFVETFLQERTLHHVRAAKLELLELQQYHNNKKR